MGAADICFDLYPAKHIQGYKFCTNIAVFGLYRLALNSLVDLPNFINIEIGFDFLWNWGLIILLFGLAVGLVGSSISLAVHRYIRS